MGNRLVACVVTQLWGGHCNWCPPQHKLWGGRVPPVPNGLTPMVFSHMLSVLNCCLRLHTLTDSGYQFLQQIQKEWVTEVVLRNKLHYEIHHPFATSYFSCI